jgi:hypothetical protein
MENFIGDTVGGGLAGGLFIAGGTIRRGADIDGHGGGSSGSDANCDTPKRKSSQIDRKAFKAEREAFWKAEAKNNPGEYSPENLAKMKEGRAPTGPDGHPMELHHKDRTPNGGIDPMSRTDHRLGENYKKNHP